VTTEAEAATTDAKATAHASAATAATTTTTTELTDTALVDESTLAADVADLAAAIDAEEHPKFNCNAHMEVELPKGSRAMLVSDLHLPVVATDNSTAVANDIARVLHEWSGPGVFVIAGDGFEMLAGPPDVGRILDAHPQFTAAVAEFAAGDGHSVVVLSGNHDGQLAWDGDSVRVLEQRIGAGHFSLICDLVIDTDHGPQRVRVVHGNQSDPYNTFEDPWSPVDTPFGHHIVREILPQLESRQSPGSLLENVQSLDGDIAEFIGSRLFYRKLVGKVWLLAVPFVALLLLRLFSFLPGVGHLLHQHAARWLIGFGILVVLMVIVAGVAAGATLLRVNRSLRETAVSARSDPHTHNAPARAEAARLVTEGFAGMISGHTHEPELSVVGDGFYANTGSGTTSVTGRRSRYRLPQPFLPVERFSYVELHGGVVLEVKLWLRDIPLRSPVLLERLALAPPETDTTAMSVVAALPEGPTWPLDRMVLDRWVHRRRIRRFAAWAMFAAGVLNVVFAALWHLTGSRSVDYWLPFGVHPLTVTEAVVAGLALCGLAIGVRRGLRPAWVATIAVLLITSTDRLVTGHSAIGSAIALVFTLWLLLEHRQFRVFPDGVSRLYMWLAAAGLVIVAAAAGVGALFQNGHRQQFNFVFIFLVLVVLLILVVSRPSRESRRAGAARVEAFTRARGIIDAYGGDTLDYFALRDDKSWFFTGGSFAAYSIINGVMLISPDPIGPPEDRAEVWSDVMDFAQSHNWVPSVLAASKSWLPIYRAAGLVDHYIGDEAIVDCTTFSLQGKSMKSLRGAHNRIKKEGCRVECFDDMSAVPEDLRHQLLELMTETRQGEAERGYSMTLSRIFDPRDTGLLLAVCLGPEGRPLAFNQYVPASEVNGYSLDLMRRTSDENAPNGLTDFVIIETIAWMAERGLRGLGLNFATMRAVVAGETEGGPWMSLERSVLHHFSDTMQIESLWQFNKKYDPWWNPRYVVTGPFLPLARSGLAIARAESVSELPVIGPLLKRKEPATTGD
jgi:lysylphosphatidylglycerol synthetase-like protein (DUF2156 family)/UDP-2,3-diacylglucosamine pyrophosphatase LpxH